MPRPTGLILTYAAIALGCRPAPVGSRAAVATAVPEQAVSVIWRADTLGRDHALSPDPLWTLRLAPLVAGYPAVHLLGLPRPAAARGARRPQLEEHLEIVALAAGAWSGPPQYAVVAEWRLADPVDSEGFIASRRALFALRQQHIPEFVQDILLRDTKDASRFVIVGLYATETALDAARGHPAIQAYAGANPPSRWRAQDVYGVRRYHVTVP